MLPFSSRPEASAPGAGTRSVCRLNDDDHNRYGRRVGCLDADHGVRAGHGTKERTMIRARRGVATRARQGRLLPQPSRPS